MLCVSYGCCVLASGGGGWGAAFAVRSMSDQVTTTKVPRSPGWRHFFRLLVMFLGAWCLGGMVPTLGAWSEVRSQWLGAAIVAAVCVGSIIVTVCTYRRGGLLTRLQATILGLVFMFVLVGMVWKLVDSANFLREVGRSHSGSLNGTANQISGPNAGGLGQYQAPTPPVARDARLQRFETLRTVRSVQMKPRSLNAAGLAKGCRPIRTRANLDLFGSGLGR